MFHRFHRASPPFPSPFLVLTLPRLLVLVVRPPFPPLEKRRPRRSRRPRPRRRPQRSLARSPSGANPASTFLCLNWVAFYARASNVNRILNYYSDCVSPAPRYLLATLLISESATNGNFRLVPPPRCCRESPLLPLRSRFLAGFPPIRCRRANPLLAFLSPRLSPFIPRRSILPALSLSLSLFFSPSSRTGRPCPFQPRVLCEELRFAARPSLEQQPSFRTFFP